MRELMIEMGSSRGEGFTLNPMKGTPGDFYRDRRAADIHGLCLELLAERGELAAVSAEDLMVPRAGASSVR